MNHAIRIHEYGGPEKMLWEEVPLPADLRDEMAGSGMHSREIVDPDGHQWEFITA